jgi:hypothetical protein
VPQHLEMPLRRWIYRSLQGGGSDLVALSLEIRIDYQSAGGDAPRFLAELLPADELLDVAHAILFNSGPWPSPRAWDIPHRSGYKRDRATLLQELSLILQQDSSAYRVDDSRTGLMRRVDATATAAAAAAATAAAGRPNTGSAADQIRDAWSELYGVTPNPPAAYSAAIKAVESAAHSVIQPTNSKATLGTMIRRLRDAPQYTSWSCQARPGTGASSRWPR